MIEINKENLTGIFSLLKERETTFFYSDFKFLNAHKGHRPGNLHLYLGVAHGGKSTLIRSLILDALKKVSVGKKVLVWLSEETENDFLIEFSMALKTLDQKDAEILFKKLLIHSEMSFSKHFKNEGMATKFNYFVDAINKEDVEICFFDNITTSEFYMDQPIETQSYFVKQLKEKTGECKKPLVLVAHTGAEVTENSHRLINMNDIRGCKSIINVVQYCYILQRFCINEFYFPTLRICKHRGQTVENKMYYIEYDKEKNLYFRDRHIDFLEMKENFKRRNVL
tara:strand:- start:5668 stop:6513 length:846 start_codon:yes stop_codon:yes gene_type:complete